MVRRILSLVAVAFLSLLSSAAFAQTVYDIPDPSGIDYIYYGVVPPYTNTFYDFQGVTLNGVVYTVSGYLHFTEDNPSATNGSITFTNGTTSVSETLTNINFSPFSFFASTATAQFAGQFNGSLLFNIKQICGRRYCHSVVTTVNGVHSNITLQ